MQKRKILKLNRAPRLLLFFLLAPILILSLFLAVDIVVADDLNSLLNDRVVTEFAQVSFLCVASKNVERFQLSEL